MRRDQLANFVGRPQQHADRAFGPEETVGYGWLAQDLHPAGASGNAAAADAARGAALFIHLASRLDALLDDVAATPLGDLLAP